MFDEQPDGDPHGECAAEIHRLTERVIALNADAERLDYLDRTNARFRMGWTVGVAPAGNVSVQSVIHTAGRVIGIREAIDAARNAGMPEAHGKTVPPKTPMGVDVPGEGKRNG